MKKGLSPEIRVLTEIAEMKRVYAAIERPLLQSSPACLCVTSALPGEGKTTVAVGIAALAARQLKKRILAVDLNWHAPALHTFFGLQLIGVEKFTNGIALAELVQQSGMEHLDILAAAASDTAGRQSLPDENAIAVEIIRQARGSYDYIFLDNSKVFPENRHMVDPVTVAKHADGVILVILAHTTPRQEVKRACTLLQSAGANILGVIVNQWKNPLA